MWQHSLPNPLQAKAWCNARCCSLQRCSVRWHHNFLSRTYYITERVSAVSPNAKYGSLWHHRGRRPLSLKRLRVREWYNANGRSTFTALENLLQFRTFFIASPQCAVSAALSSVAACQIHCASRENHRFEFRMRRVASSNFKIAVFCFSIFNYYHLEWYSPLVSYFLRLHHAFVALPSAMTGEVSQVHWPLPTGIRDADQTRDIVI